MSLSSPIQLSFILSVRNAESELPRLVRSCCELAGQLGAQWPDQSAAAQAGAPTFEVLVLDARSTDNSASVIGVLHTQIPQLRSLQGLAASQAIARGTRAARGSRWLISDGHLAIDDARWALKQLGSGRAVASVPGELLAIQADLGRGLLSWLSGGLATAQRRVNDHFRSPERRAQIAWKKPRRWGLRSRVTQALRSRLGRVGLAALDRPRRKG